MDANATTNTEKKKKYSFYLSEEAVERLGIAATMARTDKSQCLDQVILGSPLVNRWTVLDIGVSDSQPPASEATAA